MARKKKQQHEREPDERPAPAPHVGTSLKGLLAGVTLGGTATQKASGGAAKPSGSTAKPSGSTAKPSGSTAKPSGGNAKPSGSTAKPSGGSAKAPAATAPKAVDVAASEAGPLVVARPSESLRGHDRTAFYDAIAGVRTLDAGGRTRPKRAVPVKTSAAPLPPRESADSPARRKLGELVAGAHRFDVAIDEDGFVEGLRRDAPIEALGALRREQPRIDQTLDLHGLREAIVEERLARWVREVHKKGARRVLVIHGKGLHSSDGVAVLREAVLRVLEASIATPLVLAFSSAPVSLGGTGATLVELTRERS